MIDMTPRKHHYALSHTILPKQFFKDPDKIMGELTGPMGSTFLFFLWEEIGKIADAPLKHVGPGKLPGDNQSTQMFTLGVTGIAREGSKTLVIITMPPSERSGEAVFLGVFHDGSTARYFAYERNSGMAALGENPNEAYLAEYRGAYDPFGDTSLRTSHGSKPGTDQNAFAKALCDELGMDVQQTLAQLGEEVPNPVSSGLVGSMQGGASAQAGTLGTGRLKGVGKVLTMLLIAILVWPAIMMVVSGFIYALLGELTPFVTYGIECLMMMAMMITLWVWLYKLFSGLGDKTKWSPAMAVVVWFIPILNMILPPFVLRSGWRAVSYDEGGFMPFVWWMFHIAWSIVFQVSMLLYLNPDALFMLEDMGIGPDLIATVMSLTGWASLALRIVAFGSLLYIVRGITDRA